jgi:N-methylhydantoinase A/oxoprolinase/acetone carboxylase beta subunit
MSTTEHEPRVLAIDAGGTMTDTFIVDATGHFVVGKAQTTPDDESVGLMRSAEDALRQWVSSRRPASRRSARRSSRAPRCSTGC